MKLIETNLPGVILIEPRVFGDERGFFQETYRKSQYIEAGFPEFVQDNHSRSRKGVLRGLHYQLVQPQGKLVSVTRGAVFDVAVDVRKGSPTFGEWTGHILSDENHHQLYVPSGFAHGFCVLSDEVDFTYKCTDYYHAESEQAILWNDLDIGIQWPDCGELTLSAKDQAANRLGEMSEEKLPVYAAK